MSRRRGDEDGAALIGALVFVMVCSMMVTALLGFVDTDFRTTIAVRDQREEAYAADAAVEAAIRNFQKTGACHSAAWQAPGTNGLAKGDIAVTCSADGSNAPSLGNAPQYSILTRGNASDDGIRAVSGALTPARGGVFVEGRIEVTAGAKLYVAQGDVTANGACSGTIQDAAPTTTPDCGSTATPPDDPAGIDEAPAVPDAALPLQAVPACPGDGSPIVFSAGRYTDLVGLKVLTTSCSSNTFHFPPDSDGTPGFFHFDFTGGGEWSFGNGETVVGGTLLGPLATINTLAAGKKCDEGWQGVQFIFSGESRVGLGSGAVMELCPPLFADTTTQRVTVYGPTLSAGTAVTQTNLRPTTATSTGNPVFSPTSGALLDDGIPATVTAAENRNAKITASSFALLTVPAGATVTKVEVTIEHKESATPAGATLTAEVTGGSGSSSASTTLPSSSFTRSSSYVSQTFDVSSTFDTVDEMTNFKVAVTATNPNNSGATYTQDIDFVSVSVTYTPAGVAGVFPPATGCVVTGSTCPLIKTQGQAVFTSKGTIYAPLAMLNIQLVGPTYQVFGRGVIVRRLDTDFTSSIDCNIDPLPDTEEYDSCYAFQLPRNRTLGDNVVFTATYDGRTLLRAHVDFSAATPKVKRWSSVNEDATP